MRCFYHTDKEAVGSCKSCGKGLCLDCATDLEKGLACRGKCEADVKALIELIERNIRISARAEASLSRSQSSLARSEKVISNREKVMSNAAIFNLIVGVVFALWGVVYIDRFAFLLVLGICFFVYGTIGVFRARKPANPPPECK